MLSVKEIYFNINFAILMVLTLKESDNFGFVHRLSNLSPALLKFDVITQSLATARVACES